MSVQQIVNFLLEIDKLKSVTRKVRPLGLDRYENSAEHSWQICVFALSLAEYSPVKIDMNRVVRMLLVHDIGEIETGDTFFFTEGGWKERKAAEYEGVRRIFSLLPESLASDFLELWVEFEAAETPEARFATVVDRAMPVLLNLNNQGQSWRENGVSYETVVARVGPPIQAGCPALWSYLEIELGKARDLNLFGTPAAQN